MNVPGVYAFHSGKNKVTINYELGGRYYSITMDPLRDAGNGGGQVRVYEVRIW